MKTIKIELDAKELQSLVLNSSDVQTEIVREIVIQMKDYNGDFKNELLKIMKEAYEKASEEYIRDYVYSNSDALTQIKNVLNKFTKEEIIEMLK